MDNKKIVYDKTADDYSYNVAYHTRRIADILEEVLQLVKEDLEKAKKYREENK